MITSSTGGPALTMIMIFRGRFSESTSSWTERVPTIFFPLARPSTNASTFDVVRLNTATVKPWLSMFRTRFSPITARPIRPMSAVGAVVAMIVILLSQAIRLRVVFGTGLYQSGSPVATGWVVAGSGPDQVNRHVGRSGSSAWKRAMWAAM